jgi:uncharacterized protein YjiS (DUF1127 family)
MSNAKTTGLLLTQVNKPDYADWRQRGGVLARSIKSALADIWIAVRHRLERGDSQRVSKLSDHLLADIGITREQAKEIDRRKR